MLFHTLLDSFSASSPPDIRFTYFPTSSVFTVSPVPRMVLDTEQGLNSYMSSEGMALMMSSNSQSKILCIPAPTAPVQGQPTLGPAPVVCKLRRQHLPPHGANAPTNPVILTLR